MLRRLAASQLSDFFSGCFKISLNVFKNNECQRNKDKPSAENTCYFDSLIFLLTERKKRKKATPQSTVQVPCKPSPAVAPEALHCGTSPSYLNTTLQTHFSWVHRGIFGGTRKGTTPPPTNITNHPGLI